MSRLGGRNAYRLLDDGGAGFTSESDDGFPCSIFRISVGSFALSFCGSLLVFIVSVASETADGGGGANATAKDFAFLAARWRFSEVKSDIIFDQGGMGMLLLFDPAPERRWW